MTYPCSTKADLVILTTGTFYVQVSVSDTPRSIYITQGAEKFILRRKIIVIQLNMKESKDCEHWKHWLKFYRNEYFLHKSFFKF